MTKKKIASVIETSPVRLTSDETRFILRAANATKPIDTYSYHVNSLCDLGLVAKIPMETETQRSKRISEAWRKLWRAAIAKDSDLASKAFDEIRKDERTDEPPVGYILTETGKQVAHGITVRMGRK